MIQAPPPVTHSRRPALPPREGTERVSLVRAAWAVLRLQFTEHPGPQRPPLRKGRVAGCGGAADPLLSLQLHFLFESTSAELDVGVEALQPLPCRSSVQAPGPQRHLTPCALCPQESK